MPRAKIACWNIYFSWQLVGRRGNRYRIADRDRAQAVAKIVQQMDADALGVVECMGRGPLEFFRDEFMPQYDGILMNGDSKKYNLGLLYKKSVFDVRKVRIDSEPWTTRIGDDRRAKKYKFARQPLVFSLTHAESQAPLLVAIVHAKSKRPSNGLSRAEERKEALRNRKRIVAEGRRLHELLFNKLDSRANAYERLLVMGDVNDGPYFDRYEAKISYSGVEAHIGSVLDADRVLHSFVPLIDGGSRSSSFGDVQLDHMLMSGNLAFGRLKPKLLRGSGAVRSDLVDLDEDGKRRDSDHAPVELSLTF